MSCERITREHSETEALAPTTVRAQFGNPTGLLGRLIGHLMAFKNAARSKWVLSLLELDKTHRVLEIGFGSGADIRRASAQATLVAGVDHSSEMVRMAESKNADAIARGRVMVRKGSACAIPYEDRSFDRVFSINSVQFWSDLHVGLCETKRVLALGGIVAIAIQPRNENATAETAYAWGARLLRAMYDVGFGNVRVFTLESAPVPTVCALAVRRQE